MAAEEGKNTYVATVVRDDFFNDPFFKNWWADFDKPMSTWDKTFNRQISGEKKYSMRISWCLTRILMFSCTHPNSSALSIQLTETLWQLEIPIKLSLTYNLLAMFEIAGEEKINIVLDRSSKRSDKLSEEISPRWHHCKMQILLCNNR